MTKQTNVSSSSSAGIGIGGAVFIVFLVMKLAEIGVVQHWSWWWVTSPLWIPFGIIGAILAVAGVMLGVAAIGEAVQRRNRFRSMMKGNDR